MKISTEQDTLVLELLGMAIMIGYHNIDSVIISGKSNATDRFRVDLFLYHPADYGIRAKNLIAKLSAALLIAVSKQRLRISVREDNETTGNLLQHCNRHLHAGFDLQELQSSYHWQVVSENINLRGIKLVYSREGLSLAQILKNKGMMT